MADATETYLDAQLLAEKIEAVLHIYEESQKAWSAETGAHRAMRLQYSNALQSYFQQGKEFLGSHTSEIEELAPAREQISFLAVYPYARAMAFLLRRYHSPRDE